MKHIKQLSIVFAAIGMLVLILDGRTAVEGARIGVDLCLKTVIPSLFPFFILSIFLTGNLSGVSIPLLRSVGKLLHMPDGSESILIPAFLGGYPVGAQCISHAFESGQLSREDAGRMLGFCSNAGPAFLFGMVSVMFSRKWMVWVLWAIHITGAIFSAQLLPRTNQSSCVLRANNRPTLMDSFYSALRVTASVCGWVTLFRVLIQFLKRWCTWILPISVQVAITGLLELSNGCCELNSIPDESLRFIICSGLLSFGGVCVALQTSSVVKNLTMVFYIWGKLLQTLFSLAVSSAIVMQSLMPMLLLLPLCLLFLGNQQKKSRIQESVGV